MVESSRDSKEALFSIKHNLPEIYTRDYKALSDIPMEILRPIPRRAVFSNATGVKVSIRKYIEESDTGKRDILLDLEQIAKKIAAV
jgi:chromosome partitioning protein